ncbi:hypothetical protein J4208_03385 [Candidatus Woesearchaeota archaeon]|nr:hypothetical protein [Candidatus Woesearchaeota archaeon]
MKSTLITALLFLFTVCVGLVSAAAPDYTIIGVEVNDLQAFGGSTTIPNLDVERGETIEIEVTLQGNATIPGGQVPDVRVEARIVGYEFGTVSDISDIFSVDEGLVYKKRLTLVIPEDIDASELYTLRVEASDSRNEDQIEFTLNIDEQRHSLNIFDILVNPSSNVVAGQPIFVISRIENLGELKEDDVRVTASIPELGVSTSNFIDELITELQEEEEEFRLDEQSSRQLEFLLRIPEDAQTGEYTLKVDVLYNRGHSLLTETRKIFVKGMEKPKEVDTLINIDSTTKRVNQNEETSFKLMFANMGTEKGLYTVQVDGVAPWGQYRVEPGFITVQADGTAEANIFIRANDNAEPRNYVSVVRVMMGREIVHEFNVNTEVVGVAQKTSTTTVKTVLAVIFIILVIALVVLGLIIAFRKMKEDNEGSETMTNVAEGQTYYYYPQYQGNQRR